MTDTGEIRSGAPLRAVSLGKTASIYLVFRHSHDKERTMVRVLMPDEHIGSLMFDYFVRMGVPVRLVQETGHPDVERIIREGNTDKS